jgi:predicted ribosome quality control (RQC) complex YloA/Tae2 family protein
MNSYELKILSKEFSVLTRSRFVKIQAFAHNKKTNFKIKIGNKDLIFIPGQYLYFTKYSIPAEQNQFTKRLNNLLGGKIVSKAYQHNNDRIYVLEFPEYKLIFELFNPGNLILLDKDNKIIELLLPMRSAKRKLEKKEAYVFTEPREVNEKPSKISSEILDESLTPQFLRKTKAENILLKKQKIVLEQQKKDLERLEKEKSELKAKGDKIYENYEMIEKILQAINAAKSKNYSEQEIQKILKENKGKFPELAIFIDYEPKTKKLIVDL